MFGGSPGFWSIMCFVVHMPGPHQNRDSDPWAQVTERQGKADLSFEICPISAEKV